jgi:hypothetical protein
MHAAPPAVRWLLASPTGDVMLDSWARMPAPDLKPGQSPPGEG